MLTYVVVGVFKGVVSEVKGFTDPEEANIELAKLNQEYNIEPGQEEESENEVSLHKIEVYVWPASVLARRRKW